MTSADPTLRLFVALELPDGWKDALGKLQDEMRAGLQRRFGDSIRPRWVSPDGIHLTLNFLGETATSRLDAIETALGRAVLTRPGFNLELANIGSFADRRAPRVILATIGGDTKALYALAERVESWLAPTRRGQRDERRFQPHLTLARLPETMDGATRKAVSELTRSYRPPAVARWDVEAVSLIRSHLGPDGARYERIAWFPA